MWIQAHVCACECVRIKYWIALSCNSDVRWVLRLLKSLATRVALFSVTTKKTPKFRMIDPLWGISTADCRPVGPLLLTWFNSNLSMDKKLHYYEMWDEITYPFSNFNSCTAEICKWITNFIHVACDNLPILGFKLTHVNNRGPWVIKAGTICEWLSIECQAKCYWGHWRIDSSHGIAPSWCGSIICRIYAVNGGTNQRLDSVCRNVCTTNTILRLRVV